MIPNIPALYHRINQRIQNLFEKNWGVAKLSICIYLLFSLIYFPEILYKRVSGDWSNNDRIVQNFVNQKINEPLKPYLNAEKWDHFRKRDLRITPYLIGKTLHIESIKLFYLQALFLFPFFIFLTLKTIHRSSQDPIIAFWSCLAILFTYVGNSFNYDTFFYDSFAFLGLIAAFYWQKKIAVIPILLATFFVDERSILPAIISILIAQLTWKEKSSLTVQLANLTWKNKLFTKVLLSVLSYFLIRYWLYTNYGLATPLGQDAGVHLGIAFVHKLKVPFALFSAFKFNFIFIGIALMSLFRTKNFVQGIAYAASILLVFLMATAVEDVTRSLAYGFILIYAFFQLVPHVSKDTHQTRILCTVVALANLLLPTYSLLLQLYEIPIFHWIYLF